MEAAKRREARRRKLLLSSEDRLKRIERLKGSDHVDGSSEGGSISEGPDHTLLKTVIGESDQPSPSLQSAPGTDLHEQPLESLTKPELELQGGETNRDFHPDDTRKTAEHSPTTSHSDQGGDTARCHCPSLPDESRHPTSTEQESTQGVLDSATSSSVGNDASSLSQDQRASPTSTHQPHAQHSAEERASHAHSATQEGQSGATLQTLLFVALAIMTRLWIVRLLEGQSIILVFLAAEMAVCYSGAGQVQSAQQSTPIRILSALLTLKGASPHNLQTILRYLAFLQGALQDFSVYLFVFVMTHIGLQWLTEKSVPMESDTPA